MIVVDSSAVVAILFGEPAAATLLSQLERDLDRIISVASYVEVGTVIAGRRKPSPLKAIEELDLFLAEMGVELAPIDATQARLALRARIEHGRGMGHGGLLNFGDTFAYALAKAAKAALLFTGDDFRSTDLNAASPG